MFGIKVNISRDPDHPLWVWVRGKSDQIVKTWKTKEAALSEIAALAYYKPVEEYKVETIK